MIVVDTSIILAILGYDFNQTDIESALR